MANELGAYLRQLRKTRHLTLAQAAEGGGISRVTLNRWETRKHLPRLPELEAVLTVLGATHAQRREALALLEAPRAQSRVREDITAFARQTGMGSMPSAGDLLRAMRLRRGMSLEQVAAHIGVSTRTLRFWEKTEVWPSVAQLHTLCYFLGAEEREVVALTCGQFATPYSTAALLTGESISQRHHAIGSRSYSGGSPDLDYLLLIADAWRLAIKQPAERGRLAHIYAEYADNLVTRERFAEATEMTERALELMPEKSPKEDFWLYAGITSARAAVYQGKRKQPHRGIRILQDWLPVAKLPEFRANMLSDMAEYLMLEEASSNASEAIRLSEQACELASQAVRHNPKGEHALRKVDLAIILYRAKRYGDTLDELSQIGFEYAGGHHLASAAILESMAYLSLGDRRKASESVRSANQYIEQFQLPHLASRADMVAQRL